MLVAACLHADVARRRKRRPQALRRPNIAIYIRRYFAITRLDTLGIEFSAPPCFRWPARASSDTRAAAYLHADSDLHERVYTSSAD